MSRPTSHHMVNQGWRPEAVTQKMLALYGDRVDRTLWPADETPPLVVTASREDLQVSSENELGMDDFPSSPIFVPRDPDAPGTSRYSGSSPGGHDGWVVVPIMNDAGFRVEVFDADHVGRGPVATLSKPGMHVPFVLHASWMPRAVRPDDRPRLRFADELERIGELPDDLADVAHRADVAVGRDRLEAHAAGAPAVVLERGVEDARDAAPAVLGVDADEVHVADLRSRRDEPEEEADELVLDLDDARELAELVEEDRVRERARRTFPPLIDDADDLLVVGLRERAGLHHRDLDSRRSPRAHP
jgi:hypothetical protein